MSFRNHWVQKYQKKMGGISATPITIREISVTKKKGQLGEFTKDSALTDEASNASLSEG